MTSSIIWPPYIPEWAEWWKKIQLKLKDDPRIDTSHSREQQYGIHREVSSRAEEIYLAFNRVRLFETFEHIYDQARRVLIEHLDGQKLPQEHLQDVLEFVEGVTQSDRYSIPDRFDAVFKLLDGKWISETDANTRLEILLELDIKLYRLNIYALNRLVEYLLNSYPGSKRIDLLATGMCSTEGVCKHLTEWALGRGENEIIARFLTTSLGEYLPPTLEEDKYPSLSARWKECDRLIPAIASMDMAWNMILDKFSLALKSVSQLPPDKASLFLPVIGELAGSIYKHGIRMQSDLEMRFLDEIIDPEDSTSFHA